MSTVVSFLSGCACNFILILARSWVMPDDDKLWTTPIGPINTIKKYFVTRHPLLIQSNLNPFASLDNKFWTNYCLLYALFILTAFSFQIGIIKSGFLNAKVMASVVTSPSDSFGNDLVSSSVMLPCLISFTFFTFDVLYGVDLQVILVGKKSFL